MRIVTELSEVNSLLDTYRGSYVQISMYNVSLKRLALKLSLPNNLEVLYLMGVACEKIKAKFTFTNLGLIVISSFNQVTKETTTIIKDEISEFELTTSGGYSLGIGLESEFDFFLNR